MSATALSNWISRRDLVFGGRQDGGNRGQPGRGPQLGGHRAFHQPQDLPGLLAKRLLRVARDLSAQLLGDIRQHEGQFFLRLVRCLEGRLGTDLRHDLLGDFQRRQAPPFCGAARSARWSRANARRTRASLARWPSGNRFRNTSYCSMACAYCPDS